MARRKKQRFGRFECLQTNVGRVHDPQEHYTLVAFYTSPNEGMTEYEDLFSNITGKAEKHKNYLIAGDANVKTCSWGSPTTVDRGTMLEKWLTATNVEVLNNNKPTFRRGDRCSILTLP